MRNEELVSKQSYIGECTLKFNMKWMVVQFQTLNQTNLHYLDALAQCLVFICNNTAQQHNKVEHMNSGQHNKVYGFCAISQT